MGKSFLITRKDKKYELFKIPFLKIKKIQLKLKKIKRNF